MFSIRPGTIISIAALFLFLLTFYGLSLRISYLKTDRDKAVLQSKRLTSEIDTQNKAIEEFERQTIEYRDKMARIEKEANTMIAESNKKYQSLLKENPPEKCEDSIQWAAAKAIEMYR